MRIVIPLLFLLPVFFTSSCLNDKNEDVGLNSCDTTYYATTIRPIILTHCMGNNAGCHVSGGSGEGDFAKFLQLKDKIDNGAFNDRVLVTKDMPPSTTPLPALSDASRLLLENWVNSGAEGCD